MGNILGCKIFNVVLIVFVFFKKKEMLFFGSELISLLQDYLEDLQCRAQRVGGKVERKFCNLLCSVSGFSRVQKIINVNLQLQSQTVRTDRTRTTYLEDNRGPKKALLYKLGPLIFNIVLE